MSNHSTHTTSTMKSRTAKGIATLAVAFLLAAAGASSAAATTLQVVNSAGIPQAGVSIRSAEGAVVATTDMNGTAALASAAPGQTFYASRYVSGDAADPCNAVPEGATGVAYTVPETVASSAQVTLPATAALSDPAFEPTLSGSERRFVGMMNDLRRSLGEPPLQISTVLSAVADRYLSRVDDGQPLNHCAGGGNPGLREQDAGYPTVTGVWAGENIGGGCLADDVYEEFYREKGSGAGLEGHYENMTSTNFQAVGVAYENGIWVTDFASVAAGTEAVAGLTGDYGDSHVADSNVCPGGAPGGPTKADTTRRTPRIKVGRVKIHGDHVSFLVTLPKGADAGLVRVVARSGHSARGLRVHGSKATRHVSGVIDKAGTWHVQIVFMPRDQKDWRRAKAATHFKIS